MRALTWDGHRLRLVTDAPDPVPASGSAVVRVRLAGICSTDLQILHGYLGFRGILGHEFVGDVVAGPEALIGRRVVGEINFACRRCVQCLAGRHRHCPSRTVMGILGADGAFAELVRVPIENLRCVPEDIADDAAVFAEPLAAAVEACDQTTAFAGARALVVGAGKLGLLVAQVLAVRGDRVDVLSRNPRSAAIVETLGLRSIGAQSLPRGYDLVVDATGDSTGLAIAIDAVRPLGAIVLKSTIAAHHDVDLAPLVVNEVTLIGSRCGNFDAALQLLEKRRIEVEPLIERIMLLDQGIEALESAGRAGALKVLLKPDA
ncbi:alcohol dehydrogenase catalytic domain-containing protein [Candidatus Binatia bacterium]|jgi:threonine dehydrogenase-like Zn-dependent dehydrogenase|nr:alcohol dehydrogenase catalytic domain-containing protein [Candidatus Binatia bacterium]